MNKKLRRAISFICLICSASVNYTCTAFQIIVKYGENDCAKCVTAYPTLTSDFPHAQIIIFDNIKDIQVLKSKFTFLDSSINFSNDINLVKRFAAYPGNTIIFYDELNDWEITSIGSLAYLEQRENLIYLSNLSIESKEIYIDSLTNIDRFYASKSGVFLQTQDSICYFGSNRNYTSTYCLKLDTSFLTVLQKAMEWDIFDYKKNQDIYNLIDPKMKNMVPMPLTIVGGSIKGVELHLAIEIKEFKIQKNKSISISPHHFLFVVINDSGLIQINAYNQRKYKKTDISFTSFRINENSYLASYTNEKRYRVWSKNIALLKLNNQTSLYEIKKKYRDPTYVKLYRKLKNNRQYFENSYVTNNSIVYYITGYFGNYINQKPQFIYTDGKNIEYLNRSNPENDQMWNGLTLYHDLVVKNDFKYVLLSSPDCHELHIIDNSGKICRFFIGNRYLKIIPNLRIDDKGIIVDLFDSNSGYWSQKRFPFN